MENKEQVYFELLTRIDHPVFARDYNPASSVGLHSPLNSIYNLVLARQLVRLKSTIDEVRLNMFPDTVTGLTINDWENQYFGFTKPSLTLSQRVAELLIKVNKRFHMNVQDVIDLSLAIVGSAPLVTRNINRNGWVVGRGALGVSTSFGDSLRGSGAANGLYLVYFQKPIDSNLLAKLDQRLTVIEKAGSTHRVRAPVQKWALGRTALGINSTL